MTVHYGDYALYAVRITQCTHCLLRIFPGNFTVATNPGVIRGTGAGAGATNLFYPGAGAGAGAEKNLPPAISDADSVPMKMKVYRWHVHQKYLCTQAHFHSCSKVN